MKINRQGSINPFQTYQNQQKQMKKPLLDDEITSAKSDVLELSSEAKKIGKYLVKLNEFPDIREAVVQEIKESIHGSTYRISPEQLAESLMKIMTEGE